MRQSFHQSERLSLFLDPVPKEMNTRLRHIPEIDIAKFLLILLVVLIHSSLTPFISADQFPGGVAVMSFLSRTLANCAVPSFMIISGFLFFRNFSYFDPSLFKRKIKSRIKTILIPYLLWNLIAAVLFLFKAGQLGYNNFGVISHSSFHILPFLRGFWDLQHGYPFDFVLWFLRNLMVFIALSPLFYIFGRYTLPSLIITLFLILTGNNLFQGCYFLIGAYIALHERMFGERIRSIVLRWSPPALLISLITLICLHPSGILLHFTILTRDVAATATVIVIAGIWSRGKGKPMHNIAGITFFIYAFHGLYATILRKWLVMLFPPQTTAMVLAEYFLTFSILSGGSFLIYRVMKNLLPGITSLLCGARGTSGKYNPLKTE